MLELVEDLLHFIEHLGPTELGDNKIIVAKIVAKGFCLNFEEHFRG